MPAVTDLDIANRGIREGGGAPIGSFDQNVPLAALAKQQYPARRAELLARHRWVFAKRVAQLGRVAPGSTPAVKLRTYAFTRPNGLVGAIHDYRVGPRDDDPKSDVLQDADFLWSDDAALWVEYTAEVAEATWPPWFQALVATVFAIDVANAKNRRAKAGELTIQAFGNPEEGGEGGMMRTAKMADSQNAPERSLEWRGGGALVEARFEGGTGFNDSRLANALLRGLGG